MSTLLVLTIMLIGALYLGYLSLRHLDEKRKQEKTVSLKKGNSYVIQASILRELADEKEIQKRFTSKRKVTVHVDHELLTSQYFIPLVQKLQPSTQIYLIVEKQLEQHPQLKQIKMLYPNVWQFFYTSRLGLLSLTRQLSPSIHIDMDSDIAQLLTLSIQMILTVSADAKKSSQLPISPRLRKYQSLYHLSQYLSKS